MGALKSVLRHPLVVLIGLILFTYWLGRQEQSRPFLAEQLVDAAIKATGETIAQNAPVYFVPQVGNESGLKIWEERFFKVLSARIPLKRWDPEGMRMVQPPYPQESFVTVLFESTGHFVTAHVIGSPGTGTGTLWLDHVERRFFATWISVVPAIFSFFLLFWRRKVLASLVSAMILGALIYKGFDVLAALHFLTVDMFFKSVVTQFHVAIVMFSLAMIWLIHLSLVNGGLKGVSLAIQKRSHSKVGIQWWTFFCGGLVFFDDYAGAMLVGGSLRDAYDRMRVSRAKLAYIVNATVVPVASLAVFSTWMGFQLGLVQDVLTDLRVDLSSLELFLKMIPFRFYCWMSLMGVFLTLFLKRDLRLMALSSRIAAQGDQKFSEEMPERIKPSHWRLTLPITFFFGLSFALIVIDGWRVHSGKTFAEVKEFGILFSGTPQEILATLGHLGQWMFRAHTMEIMASTAVIAACFALLMSFGGGLKWKDLRKVNFQAGQAFMPALKVLISAWIISALCRELQMADFLLSILSLDLHPRLLPALTFFVAALLTTTTGSSWNAMALLIPMVGPMAYKLGGMELLVMGCAAVFDGAVFGDQVSPLSDSTVFVSLSSGCDLMTHLRSQLSYALVSFGSALIFGFFLTAHDIPYGVTYILGTSVMVLMLLILGRQVDFRTVEVR